MILKNPAGRIPRVSDTAYVSESAVIIGNVEIIRDVYIAPHTTIRADEPGSAIIIKSGCNLQDKAITALSGLAQWFLTVRWEMIVLFFTERL